MRGLWIVLSNVEMNLTYPPRCGAPYAESTAIEEGEVVAPGLARLAAPATPADPSTTRAPIKRTAERRRNICTPAGRSRSGCRGAYRSDRPAGPSTEPASPG